MTDQVLEDIPEKDRCLSDKPVSAGDVFTSEVPVGMTLESSIIDLTGEMGHLNELVMLHVERSGGFTSATSFTIVTPILDMLEVEVRYRYVRACQKTR